MYLKNDTIEILEDFQDEGDGSFIWKIVGEEEKGRVDISPMNTGLTLPPIHTVNTYMIRKV